jgi:spectinomycin phosphotransferase
MLTPPDINVARLTDLFLSAYALHVERIEFLPIGADPHSAAYRADAAGTQSYFVKLRSGNFDALSVELPLYLREIGIARIIAPILTQGGAPFAALDAHTVIVYPFVHGENGYRRVLSERHWQAFGETLRKLHTADYPTSLTRRMSRETFAPEARLRVREQVRALANGIPADEIVLQLAEFMRAHADITLDLVERADTLAHELQANPLPFTVCHSDLHAGNVLISDDGDFYIVDWDAPILAPKERDLMFIGGAQGFIGVAPDEELRLFYRGYGDVPIDARAISYYRCERIIQDIAIFCDEIMRGVGSRADREQGLRYLMSNYEHGGTIERAM